MLLHRTGKQQEEACASRFETRDNLVTLSDSLL